MNIQAGKWVLDPSHSTVTFSVRHLMISKVKGSFGVFSGTAETTNDITDTKVDATIDVTSIDTKDANRDGHLRSPDFFDTENYPTMTFTSTSVEATSKEDHYLLHGNLTIRDITKPVTFKVEIGGSTVDPYGQTKAAAEANTTINRTEFGLTWNSALETGGVLVGEDVQISINAQAVLQK